MIQGSNQKKVSVDIIIADDKKIEPRDPIGKLCASGTLTSGGPLGSWGAFGYAFCEAGSFAKLALFNKGLFPCSVSIVNSESGKSQVVSLLPSQKNVVTFKGFKKKWSFELFLPTPGQVDWTAFTFR